MGGNWGCKQFRRMWIPFSRSLWARRGMPCTHPISHTIYKFMLCHWYLSIISCFVQNSSNLSDKFEKRIYTSDAWWREVGKTLIMCNLLVRTCWFLHIYNYVVLTRGTVQNLFKKSASIWTQTLLHNPSKKLQTLFMRRSKNLCRKILKRVQRRHVLTV